MPRQRSRAQPANRKQLLERGQWILDYESDHASAGYADTLSAVRRHFLIGKTAGEQAIKQAREMRRAKFESPEWTDRIAQMYLEIHDDARANGDRTNARKAIDSMRAHLGIGAPARHAVEHSGQVDSTVTAAVAIEFADLSDEELAVLARLDQPLPKPDAE